MKLMDVMIHSVTVINKVANKDLLGELPMEFISCKQIYR